MRRKWLTNTAFPDASQTMPDTRKEHFFQFPEDEQHRKTLLRFLNRSDAQEFKLVLVCAKHFSDHVINKNEKRLWFIKTLKHVPWIASPSQMFWRGSRDKVQRKPPMARIFQEDQLEAFKKLDSITIKFGWYQWNANEVFRWRFFSEKKKTFTEATTRHSRIVTHLSFRWLKPSCGIYYKELWYRNYDEKGDLHDGVVCLMLVGLKRNMSYGLHSIPK